MNNSTGKNKKRKSSDRSPAPKRRKQQDSEATSSQNVSQGSSAQASSSSQNVSQGSSIQASAQASSIDPAQKSETNQATRELAVIQTTGARKMLENPTQEFRDEIGKAADNLYDLYKDLSDEMQKAMGARLFGSEGLMAGKEPKDLLNLLERVRRTKRASARDRSATIALMGDIGALYADTGATTGVQGRTAEQAENLRRELSKLIEQRGLTPPTQRLVRSVQSIGGSKAVGPMKSQERSRPPGEKPSRTGIHDTGREVDSDYIGSQTLSTSQWDVAHINRNRVEETTEPLVGHMSGSPAEILQVWDLLRGETARQQYKTGTKDRIKQPRMARPAGAAAFLIGQGYHSAVEVIEGILSYTGQYLRTVRGQREDAGQYFGGGAATDLILDMLNYYTEPLTDEELENKFVKFVEQAQYRRIEEQGEG